MWLDVTLAQEWLDRAGRMRENQGTGTGVCGAEEKGRVEAPGPAPGWVRLLGYLGPVGAGGSEGRGLVPADTELGLWKPPQAGPPCPSSAAPAPPVHDSPSVIPISKTSIHQPPSAVAPTCQATCYHRREVMTVWGRRHASVISSRRHRAVLSPKDDQQQPLTTPLFQEQYGSSKKERQEPGRFTERHLA